MIAQPLAVQAVILAGGFGMRMRPVTKSLPKALLKVRGKCFLEHQIDLLKKSGFRALVLCVHYRADLIRADFGDGSAVGVEITYSEEIEKPLGTAGALKNAAPLLHDPFMVIYGDSYLPVDYGEIVSYFAEHDEPALMTVYKNDNRYDTSNVRIDGERVVAYDKRNTSGNLVYIEYGLNIFRKSVLDLIPAGRSYSLGELFKELIRKRQLIAFETAQRFYEIGSREGLRDMENYLGAISGKNTQ